MRDEYLKAASKVITDPNILINVVSRRVKQLKSGMESFIQTIETLDHEDVALREIAEGKISYELFSPDKE
jgi:DNA-directed RNA polymerase subunit omega